MENKEKLRLAKEALDSGSYDKDTIEYIFPELKESEDEKTIKEIKQFIRSRGMSLAQSKVDSWIAWLEKQGEQKCAEWHREDEQNLNACLGYIPDEFLRRWLTDIIHVKYDKPTDKAKPKSKAGDWVVCNNGPHHIFQVIERSWPNAKYRDIKGTEIFLNVFTLDKQYHLWTIQDAKDGDVLAAHECLVLFREIDGLNIRCYCTYHFMNNPSFYVDTLQNKEAFLPSTKEQRDLLFQKMHEAGYKWDAEKKELKKIKQNPAWSEEDEKTIVKMRDFFIRVLGDKPDFTEDKRYEEFIEFIDNRLKSLRPHSSYHEGFKKGFAKAKEMHYDHWKPSDAQMVALDGICSYIRNKADWEISQDMVSDLYKLSEQLKKLKD